MIDINTHRITIALKPGEPVPVRAIYDRIKKGGYDPVTMHLRLQGRVERVGDDLLLHRSASGQSFLLTGDKAGDLADVKNADIQARLDARKIPDLDDEEAITVEVDEVLASEDRNG